MTRRWCRSILLKLQRHDVEGLGAFWKNDVPQMIRWTSFFGPRSPTATDRALRSANSRCNEGGGHSE
jgi:hypothetical protein